jgi:hypothetical protein
MEKTKIILEFKATDFQGNYLDIKHCAITTALKRAGLNAMDVGTSIIDDGHRVLTKRGDLTYDNLVCKVLGTYSVIYSEEYLFNSEIVTPIEPQDFTHELEIELFNN